MALLLKNTDTIDHNWGGQLVASNGSYTVENEADYENLLRDDDFILDLESQKAIVNDGLEDLTVLEAKLALQRRLLRKHLDVDTLPMVGESAPSLSVIGPAVQGSIFDIGDVIFVQTRIDNLVGDFVSFEAHMCVDNTVADRWIAFDVSFLTTVGDDNKIMSNSDETISIGPFLIPTVQNKIFKINWQIPSAYFEDGENYLFFGFKRIDAAVFDKENPENNPVLLRFCKLFKQRLINEL